MRATKKNMERAVMRLARAMNRTAFEMVPRNRYGKRMLCWRKGTLLLGSLGNARYEVGIATTSCGGYSNRLGFSGTKRQIIDMCEAAISALDHRKSRKMKPLKRGRTVRRAYG